MKSSNFVVAQPLHLQGRDVDLAAAEILAIHRRGIALDWPKASYLEAAAWCEANNKLEALSYWRRMAHFAGSPQ